MVIAAEALERAWSGITPARARRLQQETASEVVLEDTPAPPRTVAGVDVGFEKGNTVARAAVVVLDYATLEPLDYALARLPVAFPYVPGLLSFRECPVILRALEALRAPPELLLCDGQGIAHPRRLGIASHLGVLTGLPAVGVGKSRLVGRHDPVPEARGGWTPLRDRDETIGAVLRTRVGTKPLFISPGHRVTLATAIDHVMHCVTRYRLPETTRWADGLASNRGQSWLRRLDAL